MQKIGFHSSFRRCAAIAVYGTRGSRARYRRPWGGPTPRGGRAGIRGPALARTAGAARPGGACLRTPDGGRGGRGAARVSAVRGGAAYQPAPPASLFICVQCVVSCIIAAGLTPPRRRRTGVIWRIWASAPGSVCAAALHRLLFAQGEGGGAGRGLGPGAGAVSRALIEIDRLVCIRMPHPCALIAIAHLDLGSLVRSFARSSRDGRRRSQSGACAAGQAPRRANLDKGWI